MKRFRVGDKFRIRDYDPDDTSLIKGGKTEGQKKLLKQVEKLDELQELLAAERKHKVLIVLQGMDTSGKDGTIRHVMGGFDPQGVRVVSFKKPTEEELDHDFLWRIHKQVPGRGEVVIFNRSHYEDVLVVRVRELVPKKVWSRRYDEINDFERMLAGSGTLILKFFLHISAAEQKNRLEERVEDPTKRWKFAHGDLEERKLWNDYQKAYEDAIRKTSTEWAPWYVVPANAKWYRNWVVGSIVVDALEQLEMKYPAPDLSGVKVV
jgi:PPK2 family polyphosphate:nucleotide phosphotransferase